MVDRRSGNDPRNKPSSLASDEPKAAPSSAASDAGSKNVSSAASGPSVPIPSLPKGGGAIRGIGEKFSANPVTGTASLQIPLLPALVGAVFTPTSRSPMTPAREMARSAWDGTSLFRRSREKQTKGFHGTTTQVTRMSSCSPARKISCPPCARTRRETLMSMPSPARSSSAIVLGSKARLRGSSAAGESRMALSIGQRRRPTTRRAFMAAHPPPASPRPGTRAAYSPGSWRRHATTRAMSSSTSTRQKTSSMSLGRRPSRPTGTRVQHQSPTSI